LSFRKILRNPRTSFISFLGNFQLQQKASLFFIGSMLVILTASSYFLYTTAQKTFEETQQQHIEVISQVLSKKIAVQYLLYSDVEAELRQETFESFLKEALNAYNLNYVAFTPTGGQPFSAVADTDAADAPGVISIKTPIVSAVDASETVGIMELSYTNSALFRLAETYFGYVLLLIPLLAGVFYLQAKMLQRLFKPLEQITRRIRNYEPGKGSLSFEPYTAGINDQIQDIARGFADLQQRVEQSMKERDEAAALNREKDKLIARQARFYELGEMISNIAHQWKQPINIISNFTVRIQVDIMLGKPDIPAIETYCKQIETQIAYMSDTINMFRDFLSVPELDPGTTFNVERSIREALMLLDSIIVQHHIHVDLVSDSSSEVAGVSNEFKQVILCLVNNASDALQDHQSGERRLKIASKIQNGNCVIRVEDNGGGIRPEMIDRLFNAYETTKHKSRGTGLGLTMAKMIVEVKLNGSIIAFNTDEGACFEIVLPCAKAMHRERG
jgi:signal transduction histidine kinase